MNYFAVKSDSNNDQRYIICDQYHRSQRTIIRKNRNKAFEAKLGKEIDISDVIDDNNLLSDKPFMGQATQIYALPIQIPDEEEVKNTVAALVEEGTLVKLSPPVKSEPLLQTYGTLDFIVVTKLSNLQLLCSCLEAIVANNYSQASYYLVVNNNNNQDISRIIDRCAKIGFKVIVSDDNEQGAINRNLILKQSEADYVACIDDDCIIPKNWVETLLPILQRGMIDAIGAASYLMDGSVDHIGAYLSTDFTPSHCKNYIEWKNAKKKYIPFNNIVIRTACLQDIGVLDEQFAPALFEDADLCFRLTYQGYSLDICTDIKVHHHRHTTTGDRLSDLYLKNKTIFTKKWGERLSDKIIPVNSEAIQEKVRMNFDVQGNEEIVNIIDTPVYDKGHNIVKVGSTDSIGVVVTCHERYLVLLRECLNSIDNQTLTPCEKTLVLDSCEPPAWLASKNYSHWKILRGDWKHPAPGRNLGWRQSACDWLVFFDADNIMPPDYIEKYSKEIGEGIGFIYSNILYVDEKLRVNRLKRFPDYDYWELRRENYIDTSSCWNREAIAQADGFPFTNGLDDKAIALEITRLGWRGLHSKGSPVIMREHDLGRRSVVQAHSKTIDAGTNWDIRTHGLLSLLAGRRGTIDYWLDWVNNANLPPKTNLHVIDNSSDPSFTKYVQDRLSNRFLEIDYQLVNEHFDNKLPPKQLFEQRHKWIASLYSNLFNRATEDMLITFEDDMQPPLDALIALNSGFYDGCTLGANGALYALPEQPEMACCSACFSNWLGQIPISAILERPTRYKVGFIGGGLTMYAGWAIEKTNSRNIDVLINNTYKLGWDAWLSKQLIEGGYDITLDGRVFCEHHIHGIPRKNNTPS